MEPHCSTPTPTKTSHRFTCTRTREQAYLVASVRWSAPVVGCSSSVQAGAQRPHRGELISIKPRARDAHSQPSANPLLRRGLPKFLLPFFLWIFFLVVFTIFRDMRAHKLPLTLSNRSIVLIDDSRIGLPHRYRKMREQYIRGREEMCQYVWSWTHTHTHRCVNTVFPYESLRNISMLSRSVWCKVILN